MATQAASPPTPPSARVVGNAFVEQYYHILHHSPDLVHRFYQESSVLSRPDPNGQMTSVTTIKGIDEKILSMDYKNHKLEIKTADAQESYKKGVIVLVTGCLISKNELERKFAQSFFLAPQDNGYFVLNDILRYIEDNESLETGPVNDPSAVTVILDPETTYVPGPPGLESATSHVETFPNVDPLDNAGQSSDEEEVAEPLPLNENVVSVVIESSSTTSQEDGPKKSYASIVEAIKGSNTKVYVPTTARVVPAATEKKSPEFSAPDTGAEAEPAAYTDVRAPTSSNTQDEAEGHSIYIRNLPFNVTVAQLELEFKKFGPIKQGGIQVRNNKQYGSCFGFVEFESVGSMTSAIQASPIIIGGRKADVEIKRTTTRVGGGRGGFPSERGAFRNNSFRSRGGNFGGGQGFGRNEFGNHSEFSGRGRGYPGHRGGSYQPVRGRVVHRGRLN